MPSKKPLPPCLECGAPATFAHHVIPRSLGGTATVPLCGTCHPRAHNQSDNWPLAELTKEALRRKKERGERTGGTLPYGSKLADGNRLEPVPFEMEGIAIMRSLKSLGLSLRGIAFILNEHGVPTKTGRGGWDHRVIRDILLRTKEEA